MGVLRTRSRLLPPVPLGGRKRTEPEHVHGKLVVFAIHPVYAFVRSRKFAAGLSYRYPIRYRQAIVVTDKMALRRRQVPDIIILRFPRGL